MARSTALMQVLALSATRRENLRQTLAQEITAHQPGQVQMAMSQGAGNSSWSHAKQSVCNRLPTLKVAICPPKADEYGYFVNSHGLDL